MKNEVSEKKGTENLEKVTVRFSKDALSVIDELAERNGRTRSEVIRLAVDNRLMNYLEKVSFVEHEDAVMYRKGLADVLTALEDIHQELNRIGVNYNQELKLKHIEKKYEKVNMNYDMIRRKRYDEEQVIKDQSNLNKQELSKILERYENATKKVSDLLCLILE